MTKGRRALYATNEVVNSIAKLDGRTGELVWEIPIGDRPSEILVTPSGRKAFVSVRNENTIKVVDVARVTPVVVGEALVGTQPDTLSLTPDGRTLVVGLRGTPATMALVDTRSLSVRHVSLTGSTTGHQWLSADGRYTFIAVESPGGVATVHNRAGEQIEFYPYPGGATRPHGVFFDSRR
ncbi:MAG: YncE family protein [Gaiellaceae bacterium]